MSELPEKIGRYEILEVLGRGGMGVVYKAHDPNLGRPVALKVISLAFEADDDTAAEMRERFRREAVAAGVLQHPNIVTVFDAGEDRDVPYIALEYIEGVTLGELMARDERMSLGQACSIISQVAAGIGFAHGKGIIHRDLKPGNIIITGEGVAKIMDFGIARVAGSELTRKGMVMGSTSYMSPEQVSGQEVDGRSDIFSLGVILYQLLTGEKPFPGDNPTTISYRIVRTDPVEPSQLNPVLDRDYNQVLAKALAKRPDDRYANAEDLARDLQRLQQGKPPFKNGDDTRPLTHTQTPLQTAPQKRLKKPWERTALFFALAAMLLAAVVFVIIRMRNPYAQVNKLIENGLHQQAIKELLQIREKRPDDPKASYLLGRQYAELNDFNAGIAAYAQALERRPAYNKDPAMQKDLIRALALPKPDAAIELIAKIGEPIAKQLRQALKDLDYNTHWNAAKALRKMNQQVSDLPLLILDLKYNQNCSIRKKAENKIKALEDPRALRQMEQAKKQSKLPPCPPPATRTKKEKTGASKSKQIKLPAWMEKIKEKLKNP